MAEGFGAGFNGPLVLAAEFPKGADTAAARPARAAPRATPDVAAVVGPTASPSGDAAVIRVIPSSSPQSVATTDLVGTLRDDVIPAAVRGSDVQVRVGGLTASSIDVSERLSSRLPIFIGAVLVLSFLLLMAVFRSLLVPLKAVIMNLLSIGAAYGVVVAIFEWGWGSSLLGVEQTGPIAPFVPMMMFAILFGLSMDYEVFLLSRIREEYDRTGDNAVAVADGLASTARVITAAALIMVTVFGSFILGDATTIKLFGLGLATAILVDATVVRMVLVPATMELLGDRNWWFPTLARPDHPPSPRRGRARRRRRTGPAHRGGDGPGRRLPHGRGVTVRAPNPHSQEPPVTEAVIVAAARTPIGRARKGSLVDVDAFRLAEIAVGEAIARSGVDAPTSTTSSSASRSTAVVTSPATLRCPRHRHRRRPRRQPSLRVGPERGAAGRREHQVRHGHAWSWPVARTA